jgi:cyclopropane-fatty-acyl-phospholipid synthase
MGEFSADRQGASGSLGTRILSYLLDTAGQMVMGKPRVGGVTFILPSGRSRTIGERVPGLHATVKLNNFKVLGESIRRSTVGFAASYIKGDVEVDDLTALFRFVLRNQDKLGNASPGFFRRTANDMAYHLSRRNTREGARKNISEHYDLGNSFYREWLDDTMTYSSAFFTDEGQTLEDGQIAKYRRVADLAEVKSDARVLEIGCGWGGFAETLTRDYGAYLRGITLSKEQLEFSRRRMASQGLQGRAEFHFEDYRDTGGQYDHVASIEMIEAVGEDNWPAYFRTVYDRLRPGGTAAIQAITIDEAEFEQYRRSVDFIQRYVFPGGMLLTKSIMQEQGDKTGLVLEKSECFGPSYARTLAIWRTRFLERWAKISAKGFDEEFKRKWVYYLSYCEAGFAEAMIDVGIYKYRKPA